MQLSNKVNLTVLGAVSMPLIFAIASHGTEVVHIQTKDGAVIIADKRNNSDIFGRNDNATKIKQVGSHAVTTLAGNLETVNAITKKVIFDPVNLISVFLKSHPSFDPSKETDINKLQKYSVNELQKAVSIVGSDAKGLWPPGIVVNNLAYLRYRPSRNSVEVAAINLAVNHGGPKPQAEAQVLYFPEQFNMFIAGSHSDSYNQEWDKVKQKCGGKLPDYKTAIKFGAEEILRTHKMLKAQENHEVGDTCDIFVLDKSGLRKIGKSGRKLEDVLKYL